MPLSFSCFLVQPELLCQSHPRPWMRSFPVVNASSLGLLTCSCNQHCRTLPPAQQLFRTGGPFELFAYRPEKGSCRVRLTLRKHLVEKRDCSVFCMRSLRAALQNCTSLANVSWFSASLSCWIHLQEDLPLWYSCSESAVPLQTFSTFLPCTVFPYCLGSDRFRNLRSASPWHDQGVWCTLRMPLIGKQTGNSVVWCISLEFTRQDCPRLTHIAGHMPFSSGEFELKEWMNSLPQAQTRSWTRSLRSHPWRQADRLPEAPTTTTGSAIPQSMRFRSDLLQQQCSSPCSLLLLFLKDSCVSQPQPLFVQFMMRIQMTPNLLQGSLRERGKEDTISKRATWRGFRFSCQDK